MIELTAKAQQAIADYVADETTIDPDGPLLAEGGRLYLRYDELRIENPPNQKPGLLTNFIWRHTTYGRLLVSNHSGMKDGRALNLTGIEGRTEVVVGLR